MLDDPNRRIQDGMKLRLLCGNCERLLSAWEREFNNNVFAPFHATPPTEFRTFPYGPWAIKFAASVVWRVIQYMKLPQHGLDHLDERQLGLLKRAEHTWASFMRNEIKSPSPFELHIYQFPPPSDVSKGLGDSGGSFCRYLARTVDLDLPTDGHRTLYVYAKLPSFVVLGFVEMNRSHWRGGKLMIQSGRIGCREAVFPEAAIEHMHYRARYTKESFQAGLSEKQRAKLNHLMRDKAVEYVASPAFNALLSDIALYGGKAVLPALGRSEDLLEEDP